MRLHKSTRLLTSTNELFNYQSKYNVNEEKKIFKFLNDSTPDDILKLSMSQQRLKRIISRKSKGMFNSFSDILAVDGLGIKIMEKMCDSIINSNVDNSIKVPTKNKARLRGQYLEPMLKHSESQKIESAVGIFTNVNTIGWARIEKNDYIVTDWKLFDIGNDNNKKLTLCNIMEIVWGVIKSLPESDIYIMESEPTILRSVGADANNPRMVHVNLQKAQMVAMIAAAINTKKNLEASSNTDDETFQFSHNVYYLRSALPSRLFKTLIGRERVSSQSAVENIMRGQDSNELNKLNFLPTLKGFYQSKTDVEQEMLSQTLLIVLTFFEVCVFQNISAIQRINNIDVN